MLSPRRRRSLVALFAALTLGAPAALLAAPASAATNTGDGQNSEQAERPEAVATLHIIEDGVTVRRGGSERFKDGKEGQKLRVGDTVKTDATGFAQIDYRENESFTRLDVNTEFTIVSLTDDEGNRKVEGSLDVGRTWNRTTALTESETFSTEGAGATAAVEGTAYLVTCTSPNNCIFIAVVDGVSLRTVDGEVQLLDPLQQCDATEVSDTDSNLCDVPEDVALEVLLADGWLALNVFLDAALGLPGPVVGIIEVEDGQVTSFTPIGASGSSTNQPPTDNTPPPPPPSGTPCGTAEQSPPIVFDGSPGDSAPPPTLGGCPMSAFGDDPQPLDADVTQVQAPDGSYITFSVPLNHREVGDGWATWSHGYTGDVYFHDPNAGGELGAAQTVVITLPTDTYAFYFYVEPNSFDPSLVTATANGGTTSGAIEVIGDSGATYFGFYSTSFSSPLVSIEVSSTDPSGFAIGEFGIYRNSTGGAGASALAASTIPPSTEPPSPPAPEAVPEESDPPPPPEPAEVEPEAPSAPAEDAETPSE